MKPFHGDISNLYQTILELEAKQIFDKENFTELDEKALTYLCDYNGMCELFSPSIGNEKKVACIFDCLPINMPAKYGFLYKSKPYVALENALIQTFFSNQISEVWVDMSQGFAIAAANAVIRMKRHGFDITLNIAIPYKGHDSQIYGASKTIYDSIIKKGDLITQVSDLPKNKESFKNGMLHMINRSDVAICCNTKAKNNTFFLNYCKEKNVEIIDFNLPAV